MAIFIKVLFAWKVVGQHGLSEAVLAELESTMTKHELLKIKIRAKTLVGIHYFRFSPVQTFSPLPHGCWLQYAMLWHWYIGE
jgi:hypothetical protein